jgi:hypothetical protein
MRYVLAVLAAIALSACGSEDPTGVPININGDHNNVNVPSGGTGNTLVTPAPVVVPDTVIVAPEAKVENEG